MDIEKEFQTYAQALPGIPASRAGVPAVHGQPLAGILLGVLLGALVEVAAGFLVYALVGNPLPSASVTADPDALAPASAPASFSKAERISR
jgi:hypothetical protein